MCGIVGYIGTKKACPILLAGLTRLEYRGYDSAGISTIEKDGLSIMKDKGRVKNLSNLQGIDELEASGVIYRVVVETVSAKHLQVQRDLRKEIKKALDKANIKIPYQQIEVHNGK